MAKKLTLNETWRLCLSMWKQIAKQKRAGDKKDVESLKEDWLKKYWTGKHIYCECFFCDYQEQRSTGGDSPYICPDCPAVLVDPKFNCLHKPSYNYKEHPTAFYNKLVSLNRKRKSHSKPAHRKAAE